MSKQNTRDVYGARKDHIRGQSRAALTFVLVVVLLSLMICAVMSPLTPEFLAMASVRLSAQKLNPGDNAVSDYYPLYDAAREHRDFAVSFVWGLDGTVDLITDYLMYLNRDCGVTRVGIDLPPYAVSVLNSGLGGLMPDEFSDAAYGTVYASDEFRELFSGVSILNAALTPSKKISFISCGLNAAELERMTPAEAERTRLSRIAAARTGSGGILFLLSRTEAHTEDGFFRALCESDPAGGPMLTDIIYSDTAHLDGSDERYTDIRFPFGKSGCWLGTSGIPSWILSYFRFLDKEYDSTERYGGLFSNEYFLIVGSRASSEITAEETVGEDYDYGY